MSRFLGIDTSNYTTSCAVYDSDTGKMVSKKKLLPVSEGQRGLRQSDAVFLHTRQLPELIKNSEEFNGEKISAVGVSVRPCDFEGSYMPCFLCGAAVAAYVSEFCGVPLYSFSHQRGHIAAALYSSGRDDLFLREFYALHVSGGTTDLLHVFPDRELVFKIERIGGSSDLKAGQLIDRVGVKLGLAFPCGREIERLSCMSDRQYLLRPSVNGTVCSLSGVENKAEKMMTDGETACDIARFVLESVFGAVYAICNNAKKELELPFVFAGGVMSNKYISDKLSQSFDSSFAAPEYSCDNAAGIALLALKKHYGNGEKS